MDLLATGGRFGFGAFFGAYGEPPKKREGVRGFLIVNK